MTDKHVSAVAAMLVARSNRGLDKYGCTLERTDLTTFDWLQHLQEELLDAALYVNRLKEEFKNK